MKINDIIVLDNDERFMLLKEVEREGSRFFLSVGVDKDEKLDQKKLVILKLISEEDGDYMELIEDEELLKELAEDFKDTFD